MIKKIFVLGRTGSGKSTTVRFLKEELQQLGWAVANFNDYHFLLEMFREDDGTRFRSTELDGFEVLEPSLPVYEEAFQRLKEEIRRYHPPSSEMIITIEFTSNNYHQALKLFGDDFLQDTSFLFLFADLKTCLNRVNRRATNPESPDDYFVPENVLLQHYPIPYMPPIINKKRFIPIPNTDGLAELEERIRHLVPDLLKEEKMAPEERVLLPV